VVAWRCMNRAVSTSKPLMETTADSVVLRPVVIPATQPSRYISFTHALNLRFPEEDTGDCIKRQSTWRVTEQKRQPLVGLAISRMGIGSGS
jgi:hypothetical protein